MYTYYGCCFAIPLILAGWADLLEGGGETLYERAICTHRYLLHLTFRCHTTQLVELLYMDQASKGKRSEWLLHKATRLFNVQD